MHPWLKKQQAVPQNLAERKQFEIGISKLIRWKEILMKKIAFVISVVFLLLSGVTLAQQTGEEKKDSSMQGMMQGMMKGGQSGEGEMKGMDGMMRMMKMMEQCNDMMKSTQHNGEKAKETQQK